MPETVSLKLPLLVAEQAQKHVTHNEALRALDALVQLVVKDRDLATPPASPAEGDRYIVAASPTGLWSGRAADIAVWQDGAWDFHDPREGWRCWVEDENASLVFDGSAWVDGGNGISVLQNLTMLGVGTTADATNPFSAKLNKALWTAKYAAEGGDGDLRWTMNKETAADVLSLLLQRAFSGRAEIGLIGDDDLTIKVSPDGSSWVTALVVDKDNGQVRVAPAGSYSEPSLVFAGASDGFYSAGASFLNCNSNMSIIGLGVSRSFNMFVEAALTSVLRRYESVAGGPEIALDHYRGTLASSSDVVTNDELGRITFRGRGGGAGRNGAQILVITTEATPGASAMGSRLTVLQSPLGSATLSEIVRLEHATGLSMFGANPVIDQDRNHLLRVYTIATLPTAASGKVVQCSDLGGGAGPLVGDGTGWLHAGQGGHTTVASNAAFTLTPLTSAPNILHTGALTANRTVTLSTTNARPGSWFAITRTGAGAFNLDIGGLKSLVQNTWCVVKYDGSAWFLAAYGAL